jgi:hypothetical protein
VLIGDGNHNLHDLLAWDSLANRDKKVECLFRSIRRGISVRGKRKEWTADCQYKKRVLAADGVFGGAVKETRPLPPRAAPGATRVLGPAG